MTDPLFPHQDKAAERIAAGEPTYLGFDMGLGKTRTFIEAVRISGVNRVLILCPASAVLVWQREIAKWDPAASVVVVRAPGALDVLAEYFIVTHGTMSQRQGAVAEALTKCEPFDMTAIDEAQAYNAPSNIRVNALNRASHNLGQIVPLSGTPMKNHAGDLFTLLNICWPEGIKLSRAQFESKFCVIAHRDFQRNGRLVRVIEGSKNIPELRKLIAPFMLRVRKEDVLKDLPSIIWDTVPVPLDPTLIPVDGLATLTEALTGSDDEILAALKGTHLMTQRRLLGLAKLRGATDYLVDMLDNLPGDRKVLVFAHHADVIKALHSHLAEYSPAVLTGASTAAERSLAVDMFLSDPRCRVFIGNIQAAGTAITLIGPKCKCSDVVFVESSWTPMDNAQAACRVHRIGQKDGVVVRMLSASGTVDDLINGLLVRKAREFTQLFDNQGETT